MGIDGILNRLSPQAESGMPFDFKPEKSLTERRNFGDPNAETAVFIIPGWHANMALQNHIAKKQAKLGSYVTSYAYDDAILSADIDLTLECFKQLSDEISKDVTTAQESGAKHLKFIATSLGTAILAHTLGEKKISGEVTLIVPGGDFAVSLWTGIRTQHLRKEFEGKGVTLEELKHRWQTMSATYQAEHNIQGCDVTMYVSDADEVIRPDTVDSYVDALRSHGNSAKVIENRHLGHFGTILSSTLRASRL